MAIIVGSEYDHIDFTENSITTRHPFKDATSRSLAEDLVKVQDQDPQLENNKIWIKETPESETQVPTYEEFEELKSAIVEISEEINVGYITPGSDMTHYGVTLEKVDDFTFKLFGASTQAGNFAFFNGENQYASSGSTTVTAKIAAGTYTVVVDGSRASKGFALCYTTSTITNRTELFDVTSGTTKHGVISSENDFAVFIRFASGYNYGTSENPSVFKFALYNGETSETTVIEQKATAKDDVARKEIDSIIHPVVSPYDKGDFCTNKVDFGGFYIGRISDYMSVSLNRNTKYSEIITLFDALLAMDSSHISKNTLGTASGLDGNGNSYTMYEYVFHPYSYTSDSLSSSASLKKNPVLLLDGAIHGFEKNSTYGMYFFLYDLVNNYDKDPILSAIRNNLILKVIPVSNPYGFDNNSYYNGNDVNINRNFYTSDWSSSSADHTGAVAFDQPETEIIRDWVLANKDNLMAYFNVHTNGQYYASSFGNANALMPKFERSAGDNFYNKLAFVTQRHIQMQSCRFPMMYNFTLPSDAFFGRYQGETGSVGTASIWATEQAKVISMTFEMFNGLKVSDTIIADVFESDSKKMCSEMLGNMIAQTVMEFSAS